MVPRSVVLVTAAVGGGPEDPRLHPLMAKSRNEASGAENTGTQRRVWQGRVRPEKRVPGLRKEEETIVPPRCLHMKACCKVAAIEFRLPRRKYSFSFLFG